MEQKKEQSVAATQGNEYVTLSKELQMKQELANMQFSLSPIGQMLKEFEVKQRMAQMFAASKIVPQTYQNNVADCTIAVDMAMKMNCNPLTVMQNLVIVQGRPTWQAQFLIACINQCGRFTTLQYKQWTDGMVGKLGYEDNEWDPVNHRNRLVKREFDGTAVPNYCCQAYATDKVTGETVYGTEINMKMAVAERWVTKSGSKWLTMPKQMLIYRAASFFQRAYAPEIGMGFHTTEEIEDAVVVNDTAATATRKHLSLTDAASAAFAKMSTMAAGTVMPQAAAAADTAPETAQESEKTMTTDKPKKTLL